MYDETGTVGGQICHHLGFRAGSVFCLFVCLFVSISSYDFFVSRLYAVKINVTSFSRVVLVGFQQGSAVTLITNSINFFGPAVQIMANYSVCVVHSTLFTFNIGSLVNQVPFLSHSLI